MLILSHLLSYTFSIQTKTRFYALSIKLINNEKSYTGKPYNQRMGSDALTTKQYDNLSYKYRIYCVLYCLRHIVHVFHVHFVSFHQTFNSFWWHCGTTNSRVCTLVWSHCLKIGRSYFLFVYPGNYEEYYCDVEDIVYYMGKCRRKILNYPLYTALTDINNTKKLSVSIKTTIPWSRTYLHERRQQLPC